MRYIPVLIIPIIASVFGGCNPKPKDTDVSGAPAEVERTIEVGPRLDRGKKRNKKGSPRTISIHSSSSTEYKSKFDALIAQKRADMSHAAPGPNLAVQIDSCTESVSNTSSYRATGAKSSLSDGYEDPWNIVVMSPVDGSTDREDRAFQYFVNNAEEDDRANHRMISHYAMMSFVSTSSNKQLCLKPYYISKPSAELFGSSGGAVTSQQSTRGLVVKRLSSSYHPAIQYIVTQVPGPSIRDIVRSSGRPLSPETSLLLVANLFKAMKQLHSLQIVHGNIHWGNVGLSEDGKDLIFFDFSYAHFGNSIAPAPLQQKYLSISQLEDSATSSIPSHFRDDVLRGYEIFFFMVFGDTYSRELDAAAAASSSLSNLKKLKNEYFEPRSVFKSRNLPDWAATGGDIKDGLNAIRDELARMIESCPAETTTTATTKKLSCDPQFDSSKILENISKIFKTHKFGKYLVSDRLTLLEKILIFENERVGNLLLRDRPVTRIMSAEDTGLSNQSFIPYPRKSSRQIEAVFRGTWKRESRCFAKFITTFIGSRDVKEGQQTLLSQAKMYLLVKASEKFVDDKSISQYITGLAASYNIPSRLPYYIVRQSWPPSQPPTGLSVTGLIVSRESGAISVQEFINSPTTLSSSAPDQPLFLEKIAAKICIALIRAIQQLHKETKIVYNNFYLEKVFTATAPTTTPLSEYSPKIYLYDLSRAVHDEIAPWKPTYKTPREIYSASPVEMEKNDSDQFVAGISFDSDIYQAVEFFFKILFKSETRFTAAVSECLSMNPKRVSKRRANIDGRDFKYFEELSRKLDYGSSSRVTSILDDLEEVVLSQDANLDKYAKAIEKFEEIINLSG